jgi:hypothetical protein
MNSITHTISGLASSLFLNVGLTQVAQKFDPVTIVKCEKSLCAIGSELSNIPCEFTTEKGL